ncbi:nicotinamidase-related amidase [Streptomyces sp. PanSC19]|uniref:isochorismatase family cysteine hydrolase n=1 Tax=Streptomyces sp. PanSC19 TaxID=1520455 RepID=UPI000F4746AD|nr:isochorismatase family cysteine hydrolase [Streptomyces sp. PanSC19]ROQ23499.1 nicotinamidase-related amidase [Streptomyces sp. PanSC19]
MAKSALVVVDMLSLYEHPEAELLLPSVREALPGIRTALERARQADVPVVYVNDNFGQWRSHHGELLESALAGPHGDLVEPIKPDEHALFVLKARHSIFYETPLAYLLGTLGVGRLVLCGQVTEQCILYSALDAHIRHLDVTVARDAVAHIHPDLARAALRMMEINMGAEIRPVVDIDFHAPAAREGQ